MSTTDPFSQVMSLAVHELRTPVTVVSGYLRILLREQAGTLTEKQRKILEEADRSCARIAVLVAEMSELSRLEAEEMVLTRQSVDLAAMVVEAAGEMREGDDRGVTLETRGTDRPVLVTADRARLAAVVRALMFASLRERGQPGVIVVQCEVVPDTANAWAVMAIGQETIIQSLIDGARGSAPEFDEWRGGIGLALPVGRRVIDRLGGRLWSAAGERPRAGSALRLPLRQQPPGEG